MRTVIGPGCAVLAPGRPAGEASIIAVLALAVQNTDSGVTGTTDETVLWEMDIPPGLIGVNDVLVVHPIFTVNNNANSKTLRVRFGPRDLSLASRASLFSVVNTTTVTSAPHVAMRMRNSTTAAIMEHVVTTSTGAARGFGQSSNPIITPTVDIAVPSVLSVTAQLANGADTATLNSVIVKLEQLAT